MTSAAQIEDDHIGAAARGLGRVRLIVRATLVVSSRRVRAGPVAASACSRGFGGTPLHHEQRGVGREDERADVLERLGRSGRQVAQFDASRRDFRRSGCRRCGGCGRCGGSRVLVRVRVRLVGHGCRRRRRLCRSWRRRRDGRRRRLRRCRNWGGWWDGWIRGLRLARRRPAAASAASAAPRCRIHLIRDPLRVGREDAAGCVRYADVGTCLQIEDVKDRVRLVVRYVRRPEDVGYPLAVTRDGGVADALPLRVVVYRERPFGGRLCEGLNGRSRDDQQGDRELLHGRG